MKIIIIALSLIASSVVQAKTQPLSYMKHILRNETIAGVEDKNTLCSFSTEWQKNGDVKITATTQSKSLEPYTRIVVFSAEKAVVEINLGNEDQIQYSAVQSTTLLEDGDYKVKLFESLSLHFNNTDLESIHFQSAEVDYESDPHEDSIYCTQLKTL